MLQLAWRLALGKIVTIHYIREEFGVSLATAKRDMVLLEASLPVSAAVMRIDSMGMGRRLVLSRLTPLREYNGEGTRH